MALKAIDRAMETGEIVPLLHELVEASPEGSEESLFALRQLAEFVAEKNPWRGALYARRVLAHRPDDERAWAIVALCQTMLGNYRCAVTAYQKALESAPSNPWYAHNLGHLLDLGLNRPADALPWLQTAHRSARWSGEILFSLAHALARTGKVANARRLLKRVRHGAASREQKALLQWLDDGCSDASPGAPHTAKDLLPRAPHQPLSTSGPAMDLVIDPLSPDAPRRKPKRRGARRATTADGPRADQAPLFQALEKGLARLPFDADQRAHALALARDSSHWKAAAPAEQGPGLEISSSPSSPSAEPALPRGTEAHGTGLATSWATSPSESRLKAHAAAIAYAIAFIDGVPLSQAEVAACFRARVSALRGTFCELRARLDLTPGDIRYRSLR